MTGNVALDVVVGLAFIYAFYSLVVTTAVEIVSNFWSLRARNLEKAIERMLDDDGKKIFSGKFYNQPIIKFQGKRNRFMFKKLSWNSRPSYFTARNFSKAVIDLLQEDVSSNASKQPSTASGAPAPATTPLSPIEKIKGTLELHKNTETGKYLLSSLNDVNDDYSKFKQSLEEWFDDTMERTKGWYKRNTMWIGLGLAVLIALMLNLDTFLIAGQLSRDDKARDEYVQLAGQFSRDSAFWKDSSRAVLISRMDSLYSQSKASTSILSFIGEPDSQHKFMIFSRGWWIDGWWKGLAGCLFTALMLSLGAPFWFDLLDRLMQLRGSVRVPTSSEGKKNTKSTSSKGDDES